MKSEDVKKIAVIGAGAMGNGIAQCGIMAGYKVAMQDIEQRFVDKGVQSITESMEKLVSKGKMTDEARKDAMSRLEPIVDLAKAVGDADLIIEAAPEILDLKKKIFGDLDKLAPAHAILATNTSTMSVTVIASATNRPTKVVGMHFFNPAVLMKLVEVIHGNGSSDESIEITRDVALKMKKIPVIVKKDSPGFIYNRVNAPTGLLLQTILDRGTPKPDDFDAVFKPFVPMTPFETIDFVGLDVFMANQKYFSETLSADYKPTAGLMKLVEAKTLGKKTGKGVYDWSAGRPQIDASNPTPEFDPNHMLALQVNEATKLLEEGVVSNAQDIDTAMANGGGGIGPFMIAKSMGFDVMIQKCNELADKFKLEVFRPTKTLLSGKVDL